MSFGWSAGDIAKLIDVSLTIYKAFNDARKNASREFQLLTEEFERFHTCLGLVHTLLEEHNKRLYFGHDQFKATLKECKDFLSKYYVLGERRLSVGRVLRTIAWTEERSTINRLRTAVHGHAQVLNLYTDYMTLKTSLEARAVNEEIVENTREVLREMRRLRRQSSFSIMPFITEESEANVEPDSTTGSSAGDMAASQLEQVAKELDGFSHILKQRRDSLYFQYQNDAVTAGSGIMEEDEATSTDPDVAHLQKVLQDIDDKLERVRNGSKRERNPQVIRRFSRTDSHDSGISGISTSPPSRSTQLHLPSLSFQRRSESAALPTHAISSTENSSLISDSYYDMLSAQISMSPTSSPRLLSSSSSPTTRGNTGANTAATTPMFGISSWTPDTGTRPPSIILPSAAADWSLFCNEVKVICEGWKGPRLSKLSQRRRTSDCGLSLRAELADGSYIYHDIPALGIAIPHTSHTGANPDYKNAVMFKDLRGHRLRRVTSQGEQAEREPKYFFLNTTDHKAFQELIYGCDLQGSWDIMSIKSDREKESVTQTLRLWKDTHTGIPIILFYTNVCKRPAKTYIQEPKTSFTDDPKSNKKKPILRLNFIDRRSDRRHDRAGSISSGGHSIRSDRSERITEKALHLQWIEIEFANFDDRDNFLRHWHG